MYKRQNKEYPTISELYDRLEFELKNTDYDGEVRGNTKSALEMRIGGLLRRDLGNVFDVKISSLKPEELIQHPKMCIRDRQNASGPCYSDVHAGQAAGMVSGPLCRQK